VATDSRKVKDLMVPLDQYPQVNKNATLLEAATVLEDARRQMPRGRQPYQAVLVVDDGGAVVGKIGQLALLKALEPKSHVFDDLDTLRKAGVSTESLERVMEHSHLFQQELPDICLAAARIPVHNVMHPLTEHIDEDAPLGEAIHSLTVGQTLSLMVTRGSTPVGLIRLSDLCDEVAFYIRKATSDNPTHSQGQ